MQLHNWILWVSSILCLSSVKLSADLQSGQQQYDTTFVSSSTPNWTKLVSNVINQYVINFFLLLYILIMLGKIFKFVNLHFLNKYFRISRLKQTFCPVILSNILLYFSPIADLALIKKEWSAPKSCHNISPFSLLIHFSLSDL